MPALVNLANIHYASDRLIEAQALYERAIRLEPDCFEACFNLGNIHHDLGRYEDALGCYEEAVALNPGYADAHFYLAVTLEKIGRSQEARPHWRRYQQLAPEGEWVDLAKELFGAGGAGRPRPVRPSASSPAARASSACGAPCRTRSPGTRPRR